MMIKVMDKDQKLAIIIGGVALFVVAVIVVLVFAERQNNPSHHAISYVEHKMASSFYDAPSARWEDVTFHPNPRGHPAVCGAVNAKNLMGAYVGYRRFVDEVVIVGHSIVTDGLFIGESNDWTHSDMHFWLTPPTGTSDRAYIGATEDSNMSEKDFQTIWNMDCSSATPATK
jgi:hypothetical protein